MNWLTKLPPGPLSQPIGSPVKNFEKNKTRIFRFCEGRTIDGECCRSQNTKQESVQQ